MDRFPWKGDHSDITDPRLARKYVPLSVIPVKTGIQHWKNMDSCFRRNDNYDVNEHFLFLRVPWGERSYFGIVPYLAASSRKEANSQGNEVLS